MDFKKKIVTFHEIDGKRVTFRGKRNVILNCVISVMIASKFMRKWCVAYLTYVIDSEKGKVELNNLSIMREFPNVFPEELLGLPPERKVEVSIDICLVPLL
jgi:hypothetical protein